MIAMVDHATFIQHNDEMKESPNVIQEILKERSAPFMFLRHALDGKNPSLLKSFSVQGQETRGNVNFIRLPLLRYVAEYFVTRRLFMRALKTGEDTTYIGFDPLCALVGLYLKKKGGVRKVIFFTSDYSPKRFANSFINALYHRIDKICVFNADEVWNVSTRICDIRKKMGLPARNNIFFPNLPSTDCKKYDQNKRDRHRLITLGLIDKQLDYVGIIDAVGELREEFPDISLDIIGTGPKETELKNHVQENGLANSVHFLGYLSHERALEEISKSGIGLALYNGEWGFNYYGDSAKCREYLAFGLPVLTTDTHSTVDDIRDTGAGLVTGLDKEEYKQALRSIFKDYQKFSKAAYATGTKYNDSVARLLNGLSPLPTTPS